MLTPQDIIRTKRDGEALSRAAIETWIQGVVDGGFADYQSSALLMAIFQRGMNSEETTILTEAMMRSGNVISLDEIPAPKVDKHSTGGVGDKTSLILGPLAAAAGLCVPMISGRGLGHTGGTVDKLEAIPGFRVGLDIDEYRRLVSEIGVVLAGQSEDFVPADRKLYALRDVTSTVECIPLICASIMSKKLAEGIDALVLDVKFGRGAMMKTWEGAQELGKRMVDIGKGMSRPTSALLTRMDCPLGRAVGHTLEMIESIECLKGNGPADLMEVTMALTARMVVLGGLEKDDAAASSRLQAALDSGAALKKLRQIVEAQGGDPEVINNYDIMPTASRVVDVLSPNTGYIEDIDSMCIARAAMCLGASRQRVDDSIDHAVGVSDLKQVCERVSQGETLCRLHVNDESHLEEAIELAQTAFSISPNKPLKPQLVCGEIN